MNMELFQEPVIWVAVAFVVFMLGFLKLALPMIARGLDAKSALIAKDITEAATLREEALALLAQYKAKQEAMQIEAKEMLAHALKEAETMKADAEIALHASIERRTKLAHDKIARAEADAIDALKRSVVDVATHAAIQAATELAKTNGDAMIDHALQGIERIVH